MNLSKVFSLIVVLLALAIPCSAQSRKDRDEAKKLQTQADKALVDKRYAEAAELYGRAVTLVPDNPEGHFWRGHAFYGLKEHEKAANSLTQALNQGYKPPLDLYKVRYLVYFEQEKYDAALTDVEKALVLAPSDANLHNASGEINLRMKNYPAALAAFQRSAALAPDKADTFYNLARVNFAMGDVKAQAENSQAALSKGTFFPGESYYLLGQANHRLKNIPGAIEAYQRALNLKPDTYQLYMTLAEMYRFESRFTEAVDVLKKGLVQFKGDGRIYAELGLVYSLAGRYEDAVQAALSAVQQLPNEAAGYMNLCRAYNEIKSFDRAVPQCNTSLRLRPGDGETYLYLGNALGGANRNADARRAWSSAVAALTESLAGNPENSDNWYLLGNAYLQTDQMDKAIDAYQKCLALTPKYVRARVNLGLAFIYKKNKPAALDQYNIVLAEDPKLAAFLKTQIDKM